MPGSPLSQLSLFPSLRAATAPPPSPAPTPPVPSDLDDDATGAFAFPGQIGLFTAREARLAPVRRLLAAGRFDEAAREADATWDERDLAVALDRLAAAVGRAPTADALARVELAAALGGPDGPVPPSLSGATRRGLATRVARACHAAGPGATAGGRLAAEWWIEGGRPDLAEESARAAVGTGATGDRAARWLADRRLRAGDETGAREIYRSLMGSPVCADLRTVADPRVSGLDAEASAWGLLPTAEWRVVLGIVSGLFSLYPLAEDAGAAGRFHRALARSRDATAHGRKDLDARREMKRLAPDLFAELLEHGLI